MKRRSRAVVLMVVLNLTLIAGCSSSPPVPPILTPVPPPPQTSQPATSVVPPSSSVAPPPSTITAPTPTPSPIAKPTPKPTAFAPVSTDQLKWVKTGGPIGGLGYDVRMRPDNPNRMFVTDSWSGLNISNDGGQTWTASNDGITSRTGQSGDAIPVFCVTLSPQNPDVMWAGTQGIRGIFKSTDGGKSWVKKDNGIVENDGLSLRGFTVDPKNIDTVYAAGEISSSVWMGHQQNGFAAFDLVKGVVYKTTDGGNNWTAIWRGDNLARYVWIDPRNSNVLYVSTGLFDREAANEVAGSNNLAGVGILKSTDGGQTWRVFNQSNGLKNLYVTSLFMNSANPDVLLAGTGLAGPAGQNTNLGAYLSTDGGESWQYVLTGTAPISSVEFSTSNPSIAYAGGPEGVWRSTDTGKTWQKQTQGSFWGAPGTRAGFPIDFQVDPRNPDRLFANNYGGGNFLSEDGGKTWVVASQGYTGAYLHDIVVNPQDRDNVFVIGRTGPFRSYTEGSAWEGMTKEPAVLGGEWYAIAIDPKNPSNIIESDEMQGVIFRSTDQGNNWTLVYRNPQVNMQIMDKTMGYKTLVFAPSNSSVVYAGMELNRNEVDQGIAVRNGVPSLGVYKSTDGGVTWAAANDANTATQNINAIAVDPTNEQIIYAATLMKGIFKSTDGGKTWQSVNQGLNATDVRSLVIDPKNSQTLFAGAENGGLYISTNGGASWQSSSNGMDPQAAIRAIVVDPTNSQIVYAADIRTGVYRSDNGGKQWVHINNGLRTRTVVSMAVSTDGSLLYAATQGEGVFRMELAVPK